MVTVKIVIKTRSTQWKPSEEEKIFNVKGVKFRTFYRHVVECCKTFGEYDEHNNSCQDWNNNLLKIFGVKRRTGWSWIYAGLAGLGAGIATFWYSLPELMQSNN